MPRNPTSEQNKRLLAVSEKRQDEVVRLYLTGSTLRGVARELGVSVTTVIRDMDRARKEWKLETAKTYDQLLPEKLAQLDAIRSAAWEGWKRSLRIEKVVSKEAGENANGSFSKLGKRQKHQAGDPRFLSQLEKCLRLECQLRGLLDADAGKTSDTMIEVVEVIIESPEQHKEFKTLSFEQYRKAAEKVG